MSSPSRQITLNRIALRAINVPTIFLLSYLSFKYFIHLFNRQKIRIRIHVEMERRDETSDECVGERKETSRSIWKMKMSPLKERLRDSLIDDCTPSHRSRDLQSRIFFAGRPYPLQNCTTYNQNGSWVRISCVEGYDGGLPQKFVAIVGKRRLESPSPYWEFELSKPTKIALYAVNAKGSSEPFTIVVALKGVAKFTGKFPQSPGEFTLSDRREKITHSECIAPPKGPIILRRLFGNWWCNLARYKVRSASALTSIKSRFISPISFVSFPRASAQIRGD